MPPHRVRMIDVARAAGVSQTTVSFVLNGRDAAVPEATRQRVLEAAQELGYRTNRLARSLVRQRSDTIGVVVPFVENPFLAMVVGFANRQLSMRKRHPLVQLPDLHADEDVWRAALEELLDWGVDGLLHWWDESHSPDAVVLSSPVPVVFIGSAAPPLPADAVFLDDYGGGRAAAEHLVGLGHRRIAHISGRGAVIGARLRGLIDVVSGAHLPPPLVRECASEAPAEAEAIAVDLARAADRPTALFCHNDFIALGAFRGVRAAGLRVPEDISLVGFDDAWASRYLEPALTTVVFPYEEIVDTAIEFLLARLAGEADAPQRAEFPSRLVVRDSTAAPVL